MLSLYEERDSLIRENEELCTKLNRLIEERNREKIDTLTEKLAKYGREMFAKQCSNTWRDVFESRTENGDIRFDPSSFGEWAIRKLYRLEIPSYMSREDVLNALDDDMSKIYDIEKEEAKKILLEREAEANGEAE